MIGPISHDPRRLRDELSRATGPIAFDTETTGVKRHNHLLSVGFRIAGVNHLLFTHRCPHSSIRHYGLGDDALREALRPLAERPDLTLVGFNLPFDVRMLWRGESPLLANGVIAWHSYVFLIKTALRPPRTTMMTIGVIGVHGHGLIYARPVGLEGRTID